MRNRIQEIAPILAEHLIEFENDSETIKNYYEYLNSHSQRLGLYYKYLPLLHDSWFIETKLTENKFEIILNEYTTFIFATALNHKKSLKINHDKLVFPSQIDFTKLSEISFNEVDENGIIHEIKQTRIDEYLYEQIISINQESIDIGLIAWKENKDRPGQEILILMKFEDFIITELQNKNWERVFGDEYKEYYNYFKSQLQIGRYLSDQSICEELIDEFEKI
jgi:hypothetical protein